MLVIIQENNTYNDSVKYRFMQTSTSLALFHIRMVIDCMIDCILFCVPHENISLI